MSKMIENIPLLPLRGLLVFPSMVLHIDVGRDRSIKALEQAMLEDSEIFLVTQKIYVLNHRYGKIYMKSVQLQK